MTAPLSSPDPATGPHPSVDELADLAEELLPPAEADALRRHLTGCAECRETVEALAEVRELLGAAEPPAMPADVAARIDAALTAAAAERAPAPPPVLPAQSTQSATAAAVPAATAPPKAPPARAGGATGPGRPRPRRRRAALLLGSAAALLVLGLGGTFLARSSPDAQEQRATAVADRAVPGASAAATGAAKADQAPGGTVYRDDEQLAAQIQRLVATAGTGASGVPGLPSLGAGSGAGTGSGAGAEASGPTAVPPADGPEAGQGLTGGSHSTPACPAPATGPLLAADRGSYAGAPADVLVYGVPGRPDRLDVYLRTPDCGPVLLHRTVPAR
ncbi:hypothetical protein [Kitasatospora sp. NPDC093806]|uniref:anti-sigma factor family protein n=1 Tax=Kitasatospora sp. NPDC093806 TaxID=3155075 RepID=UPI0034170C42